MNKSVIALLLIIIGFSKAHSQSIAHLLQKYNSHDIAYISVEELKMMRSNPSLLVVDAREREEYNVSHIKNAQLIGYNHFSIDEFSHTFKDKSAPIVVYCSVGIRSEDISEKLKKAGYKNVQNLYGGIFAWKNKGYDVFNSENVKTDKVHTFSKNWAKYLKNGQAVY